MLGHRRGRPLDMARSRTQRRNGDPASVKDRGQQRYERHGGRQRWKNRYQPVPFRHGSAEQWLGWAATHAMPYQPPAATVCAGCVHAPGLPAITVID
jgi:hypothetical protein